MKNKSGKGVIITLVVIIVLLLALVVLMGMGVVDFKFNSSTKDQQTNEKNTKNENNNVDNNDSSNSSVVSQKSSVSKEQILAYYKDRLSMVADSNHLYSISDLNNDDIPELFIYVTGNVGNQIIADTSLPLKS